MITFDLVKAQEFFGEIDFSDENNVKEIYRKLAKKFHPDTSVKTSAENEVKIREITSIYSEIKKYQDDLKTKQKLVEKATSKAATNSTDTARQESKKAEKKSTKETEKTAEDITAYLNYIKSSIQKNRKRLDDFLDERKDVSEVIKFIKRRLSHMLLNTLFENRSQKEKFRNLCILFFGNAVTIFSLLAAISTPFGVICSFELVFSIFFFITFIKKRKEIKKINADLNYFLNMLENIDYMITHTEKRLSELEIRKNFLITELEKIKKSA